MSVEHVIDLLAKVACPYLTQEERDDVSRLGEECAHGLRRYADVLDGLGCMAASDDGRFNGRGGAGSGSFQTGDDLAGLLFTMANYARMTTGLLYAVAHADDFDRHPELYFPRAPGGGQHGEAQSAEPAGKPRKNATAPA